MRERKMNLRRRMVSGSAVACVLAVAASAGATGVTEFPDNGSEQGGRGGAWIARASDPLAAFYNPAGLAGQPTRLILQSNVNFQKTCFTRLIAANDPTNQPYPPPSGAYPQVCSSDGAGIDPQLAMTFHVTDRIGIGFAPLLAPSAGASKVSFPEFVKFNQRVPGATIPEYVLGPTDYMLTSANLLVLNPTLGIGWEVIDRLRVGASFQWGIASLNFTNAVAATANTVNQYSNPSFDPTSDVKAQTSVSDYFIPGFTLGAIYSATDDWDLAGWYKWSDSIRASGDIQTTTNYYTAASAKGSTSGQEVGNTALANCGVTGGQNLCGSGDNVHITVAIPMEAKVGVRYHKRRSDLPYDEHVRDPMAQDVFDVELDLTWANDSAFDAIQVRLPGNPNGSGVIPINGIPAFAPPNADIPHQYTDVYGARLGGDVNVIPDQLALRAGGFIQSSAANPEYQNVDFPATLNGGFAFGTTYRIHLSKEKSRALEVSLGYEHVFYANERNDGPNGLSALAGTQCGSQSATTTATPVAGTTGCSNGVQQYRTYWPVNLGLITNSINVLNVGLGYKF
jgi:long-subunit fatty acid transport protein